MKITKSVSKKNIIKQGSLKDNLLVSLFSENDSNKHLLNRLKMNICLVLDVSGSMDDIVKSQEYITYLNQVEERNKKIRDFYSKTDRVEKYPYQKPDFILNQAFQNIHEFNIYNGLPVLPLSLQKEIEVPRTTTKLILAIEAAKKALDSLHDGDIISLVKFSSYAQVIYPSTVVNSKVKQEIISILNSVKTEGATNLYDGWYFGAKQVAENIKENQINRVLVLTDGDATHGKRTAEMFCPNVANILDAGISTSTIGFGDSFNEELLESISISGNGNFYYAKIDDNLADIFDVEFNDMKNTIAQNIRISFELVEGVTLINESSVNREVSNNSYLIPNLKISTTRNSLFTLNFTPITTNNICKDKLLGNIIIQYTDKEGVVKSIKELLLFDIVSSVDYENTDENKEVKVQKALIEVAVQQKKAMDELAKGNRESAKNMMMHALDMSKSYGIVDERLTSSTVLMSCSVQSLNNNDSLESVKKSVHFGKYKTERGETN